VFGGTITLPFGSSIVLQSVGMPIDGVLFRSLYVGGLQDFDAEIGDVNNDGFPDMLLYDTTSSFFVRRQERQGSPQKCWAIHTYS